MIIAIIFFLLVFLFITWHRFHYGFFLFFLLLPTYLIRFHIGPLPSTFLEMILLIIVAVSFIKTFSRTTNHIPHTNLIRDTWYVVRDNKLLTLGTFLFLLGATISVFTSLDMRAAAGEWKAFYVEPVLLFLAIVNHYNITIKQYNSRKNTDTLLYGQTVNVIVLALLLCGLATSILAIYQHFTGWDVPYAFWANRNTFRVTGWYGFPNAVGLFLAPLVPLAIYAAKQSWGLLKEKGLNDCPPKADPPWAERIGGLRELKKTTSTILQSFNPSILSFLLAILFLPAALLAIAFAKSTGGLIGVLAGIGILLLFNKKTRWPAIILGIVGLVSILTIPKLTSIKTEILAQDRSGQIRISIWKETTQLLKDRPFLGAGMASYSERIAPYHQKVNGENIEIFHHPHNIFLTMWVNIGLIGLVGFILILIWFYKTGFMSVDSRPSTVDKFLIASMTTLLVTGLVDSPYIKNDLSVLFWTLPLLLLLSKEKDEKQKSA